MPTSSLARIISRRATKRGPPRRQHARQIVQRGIHVGAADRLDEGAHHVVVLVTVAVVTHRGAVHRLLHHLHGYDGARPSSCFKGDLQSGQRSPRVTGGELHQ